MRRFIATAALVASVGGYLLAAPERVNFILTNGERKSGIVAYHGGQNENLINGDLNLAQDGGAKDLNFPMDQVAVIDFQGGRPSQTELAQLPADSSHLLVLKNGTTQPGRFVNMIGGDTLLWDNQAGQRQQILLREVGRVYLNPQSARTVFNYTPGAVATAGQLAGGNSIRVDARQAWTDTGLTVKQGDRVSFQASGQIMYSPNPAHTATPDGSADRGANYPDPTVPVGALIGKIGNSKPFGVGTQPQLVMPVSGRLMLGVNDTELGDNSGAFTVIVARQ